MTKIPVISPADQAIKRTTQLLFRPFHKKIWLSIALAATLTLLGETASADFLLHLLAAWLDQSLNHGRLAGLLPTLDQLMHWLPDHLNLVILYLILATLLGTALYLLYRWLNSRGQFMLLDHASQNQISNKQSWHTHRQKAYSLLKLRIWWDLIIFNAFLLLALLAILIALPDWKPLLSGNDYTFSAWSTFAIIFVALLSLPLAFALWLIGSVFHFLATPLMYTQNLPAWPAFKFAWKKIFRPHLKPCLGYFLLILLSSSIQRLLAALAFLLLILCTCGLAFPLALIPLLGTLTLYPIALATLPTQLWQRSYMLHFLNQFHASLPAT